MAYFFAGFSPSISCHARLQAVVSCRGLVFKCVVASCVATEAQWFQTSGFVVVGVVLLQHHSSTAACLHCVISKVVIDEGAGLGWFFSCKPARFGQDRTAAVGCLTGGRLGVHSSSIRKKSEGLGGRCYFKVQNLQAGSIAAALSSALGSIILTALACCPAAHLPVFCHVTILSLALLSFPPSNTTIIPCSASSITGGIHNVWKACARVPACCCSSTCQLQSCAASLLW